MKFCQQVRSVKKSWLATFADDIIFIDGVLTPQIIHHVDKFWWRHISVKDVDMALKLCRLLDLFQFLRFTIFHKMDRDLQEYRHSQMPFTYNVIRVHSP